MNIFLLGLLGLLCLLFPQLYANEANQKIKIVATFSILQDFAKQIGQDHVEVSTLVPPNGDPHVYEPTPSDVRKLSEANLVLVNGLGFEGWIKRLVKSSSYKGNMVVCTDHIHPRLVFEGTIIKDPHAWHSIPNAKIYIRNITDALKKIDPAYAESYEKNAASYLQKLTDLDEKMRRNIDQIPPAQRKIITAHDAFGYLGHAYGIQFLSPQGISTESEAKMQSVIALIKQIKKEKIKTIFIENISDPKMIYQISRETNAKIGGTLYSDALSDPKGNAATYIDMMTYNLELLINAMRE
ncbi:MAG: metal ABC transporter solute-binding protein, Zn/Mn family [Alphaproteobacteria bacterium]